MENLRQVSRVGSQRRISSDGALAHIVAFGSEKVHTASKKTYQDGRQPVGHTANEISLIQAYGIRFHADYYALA